MIGYEKLEKTFKKLIKNDTLSHGYIFFGEPQVGKFSFATSLAMFLEREKFEKLEYNEEGIQTILLSELLIIAPDEKGSIGIDEIRKIKYFLSQKPALSTKRVVIVDNANRLTVIAQHALLKIAEEPPASSLLILITPNSEVLLDTVRSRFQNIYFPRIKAELIEKMLIEKGETKAKEITEVAYGRPGLAIDISDGKNKEILEKVKKVLSGGDKRAIIEEVIESSKDLEIFLSYLIGELAKDPIKNYHALKSITERNAQMSQFITSKRLQLEEALWTI